MISKRSSRDFSRTVHVMNKLGKSQKTVLTKPFTNYDFWDSFFSENLSAQKSQLIREVYNYEYFVYNHLNKMDAKNLFKERTLSLKKVHDLLRQKRERLLEAPFLFNPKATVQSIRINIKDLRFRNMNALLEGSFKTRFTFLIRPTFLKCQDYMELSLRPSSFDYILTELFEHDDYFTGTDLLDALKMGSIENKNQQSLEDSVCDNLIVFAILYDAIRPVGM